MSLSGSIFTCFKLTDIPPLLMYVVCCLSMQQNKVFEIRTIFLLHSTQGYTVILLYATPRQWWFFPTVRSFIWLVLDSKAQQWGAKRHARQHYPLITIYLHLILIASHMPRIVIQACWGFSEIVWEADKLYHV
jgi:hypothetical protein